MSIEPQTTAVNPAPNLPSIVPLDVLHRAITTGAGIDVVEKLMSLQERWEANQARRAFDAAMSAAKAEIPVIRKDRTVNFSTNKGRTHYRYEDLAEIARTVDQVLGQHGLSYRWRTAVMPAERMISVTCILSHRDGHSEENSLCAGYDESGNKNSIQALGSTITYLQRYSLKAALGLAADYDDDAIAATPTRNAPQAPMAAQEEPAPVPPHTAGAGSIPSYEDYLARWEVMLEEAAPEHAVELQRQWNAENALRRNIAWPHDDGKAALRAFVFGKIESLKRGPK